MQDSREEYNSCGHCDNTVESSEKSVTCSTCQISFHIRCAKVSEAKCDLLQQDDSGFMWFCKSCRRTTSKMLQHLMSMKLELKAIREERERDNAELLKMKVKLSDIEKKHSDDIQSFRELVTNMLDDVPQCDWMTDHFDALADSTKQVELNCSSIQSLESRMKQVEETTSENNMGDVFKYRNLSDMTIAAIANELEERKKRKKSVVLHNIPETYSEHDDAKVVARVLEEVSGKTVEFEDTPCTKLPRVYRLGPPDKHRTRSIKAHFKSADVSEAILRNSRNLSKSTLYSSVVIQSDMTSMQRNHIRHLVSEKHRRNHEAIVRNEEPDWTVSGGFLHRKHLYH